MIEPRKKPVVLCRQGFDSSKAGDWGIPGGHDFFVQGARQRRRAQQRLQLTPGVLADHLVQVSQVNPFAPIVFHVLIRGREGLAGEV